MFDHGGWRLRTLLAVLARLGLGTGLATRSGFAPSISVAGLLFLRGQVEPITHGGRVKDDLLTRLKPLADDHNLVVGRPDRDFTVLQLFTVFKDSIELSVVLEKGLNRHVHNVG